MSAATPALPKRLRNLAWGLVFSAAALSLTGCAGQTTTNQFDDAMHPPSSNEAIETKHKGSTLGGYKATIVPRSEGESLALVEHGFHEYVTILEQKQRNLDDYIAEIKDAPEKHTPRVVNWVNTIDALKNMPDKLDALRATQAIFNLGISYEYDRTSIVNNETLGNDSVLSVQETLAAKGGICQDIAVVKYETLKRVLGEENVHLVSVLVVTKEKKVFPHCVCVAEVNGKYYVLNNNQPLAEAINKNIKTDKGREKLLDNATSLQTVDEFFAKNGARDFDGCIIVPRASLSKDGYAFFDSISAYLQLSPSGTAVLLYKQGRDLTNKPPL